MQERGELKILQTWRPKEYVPVHFKAILSLVCFVFTTAKEMEKQTTSARIFCQRSYLQVRN